MRAKNSRSLQAPQKNEVNRIICGITRGKNGNSDHNHNQTGFLCVKEAIRNICANYSRTSVITNAVIKCTTTQRRAMSCED